MHPDLEQIDTSGRRDAKARPHPVGGEHRPLLAGRRELRLDDAQAAGRELRRLAEQLGGVRRHTRTEQRFGRKVGAATRVALGVSDVGVGGIGILDVGARRAADIHEGRTRAAADARTLAARGR
jgi:hypothetical protein